MASTYSAAPSIFGGIVQLPCILTVRHQNEGPECAMINTGTNLNHARNLDAEMFHGVVDGSNVDVTCKHCRHTLGEGNAQNAPRTRTKSEVGRRTTGMT